MDDSFPVVDESASLKSERTLLMKELGSAFTDGVDENADILTVDKDDFLKIKCISFGTECVLRSEHTECVSCDSCVEFILTSMVNANSICKQKYSCKDWIACLVIL